MILDRETYFPNKKGVQIWIYTKKVFAYFIQIIQVLLAPESASLQQKGKVIHMLKQSEQGLWLCQSCFICMDVCPTQALSIQGPSDGGLGPPLAFYLEPFKCTTCSLCIDLCPYEALEMKNEQYDLKDGELAVNLLLSTAENDNHREDQSAVSDEEKFGVGP